MAADCKCIVGADRHDYAGCWLDPLCPASDQLSFQLIVAIEFWNSKEEQHSIPELSAVGLVPLDKSRFKPPIKDFDEHVLKIIILVLPSVLLYTRKLTG
jgi:hypothetical protein